MGCGADRTRTVQDQEDIAGIDSDMSLLSLDGIRVLPGMLHTIRPFALINKKSKRFSPPAIVVE